jgi:hypothetical protein
MRLDAISAVLEETIFSGAGAPSGTPPYIGAVYVDTTTGTQYVGRNVFDAQSNSNLALPTISNARSVSFKFKHNDPSPASLRQFHNATGSPPTRLAVFRQATSGLLTTSGVSPSQILLDGVSISSGTTNPSANVWHTLQLDYPSDGILDRIFNLSYIGQIADFAISDSVGLARSYSINEGSGTTIIDSVSGQNGTLTLGSGSWQLDWVPI